MIAKSIGRAGDYSGLSDRTTARSERTCAAVSSRGSLTLPASDQLQQRVDGPREAAVELSIANHVTDRSLSVARLEAMEMAVDLLDVLAAPGRAIGSYASGTQSREPYLLALHDAYALLSEMHDEVIGRLNKARLARDLSGGVSEIESLLDPDSLTRGLRARELCDKLEEEGAELRRSSGGALPQEVAELIIVLDSRERGAARFYIEQLQGRLEGIRSSPDMVSFRNACMKLRTALLDQQAAFMTKADEALEIASR